MVSIPMLVLTSWVTLHLGLTSYQSLMVQLFGLFNILADILRLFFYCYTRELQLEPDPESESRLEKINHELLLKSVEDILVIQMLTTDLEKAKSTREEQKCTPQRLE